MAEFCGYPSEAPKSLMAGFGGDDGSDDDDRRDDAKRKRSPSADPRQVKKPKAEEEKKEEEEGDLCSSAKTQAEAEEWARYHWAGWRWTQRADGSSGWFHPELGWWTQEWSAQPMEEG